MIGTLWRPLRLALGLLTTLPVAAPGEPDPDDLGRSPLTYPLVGLLLGLLLTAACWLLFDLPPLAGAAILLALWTCLTGALHLDGLADSADALLGGHGQAQRRLDILHDPHIGTAAVAAVGLALIGKFAGLAAVLDHGSLLPLLLAPLLARGAALALMCALPYASPGGSAQIITGRLARPTGWLVVAIVAIVALFAAPRALLVAVLIGALIAHAARRRLGGGTGDVYGAAIEIIETAVLLTLAGPTQA
ncbi:MAG TPA: adenosylcobinamide-GDP ribazoletransferase [Immundisolibacter sp.]|jgi:adenosylcobinamide-GDP ribazoletransferase